MAGRRRRFVWCGVLRCKFVTKWSLLTVLLKGGQETKGKACRKRKEVLLFKEVTAY